MRLHITLEDDLVAELDDVVQPGQRSAFITGLVRQALDDRRRMQDLDSTFGTIADEGHPWDDDPAGWVRRQRRTDARRAG